MIERLRRRIAVGERQGGFTLIELLVVIVIIGVLLAIAVPSYLGFKKRAENSTAQSNLRSAIPSVEAFYADNSNYDTAGTPAFSIANLRTSYDAAISSDVTIVSGGAATYCLSSKHGNSDTYYKAGPAATISTTACT
jgi:type IV pilus assembly protein PilA